MKRKICLLINSWWSVIVSLFLLASIYAFAAWCFYSSTEASNEVPSMGVLPPAPKPSPSALYDSYLRASCRVYSGSSGGSGTCVEVDDEYVYIMTCRHVVGGRKEFEVEFWVNGRITGKYSAKLIKVYNVDAAVIGIPVGSFNASEIPPAIPLSQSTSAVKMGSTIISVGCPGFGWPTLFVGHVTGFGAMKKYNAGKKNIKFVPPPKGGRSGSGIFQDGKIVGVLWGTDGENGYAVDCRDIRESAARTKASNLFFTADWCKKCKEMKPIIQLLVKEGFGIEVIDYDLNTSFAELYNINGLPAYVNKYGETISGIRTIEDLREFFRIKNDEKYESETYIYDLDTGELIRIEE